MSRHVANATAACQQSPGCTTLLPCPTGHFLRIVQPSSAHAAEHLCPANSLSLAAKTGFATELGIAVARLKAPIEIEAQPPRSFKLNWQQLGVAARPAPSHPRRNLTHIPQGLQR